MANDPEASFDRWMAQLRDGDSQAEAEVFERYIHRLVGLARGMLSKRVQHKVDPEDVLQSVYRSFFHRQQKGQFTFKSWDDLWSLLAQITRRKCIKQHRAYRGPMRDVNREMPLAKSDGNSEIEVPLYSDEPTPDEAAALIELMEAVVEPLDERGRTIVRLRLQDYTVQEIAQQVDRTERTVRRILDRVKQILQQQCHVDSNHAQPEQSE